MFGVWPERRFFLSDKLLRAPGPYGFILCLTVFSPRLAKEDRLKASRGEKTKSKT